MQGTEGKWSSLSPYGDCLAHRSQENAVGRLQLMAPWGGQVLRLRALMVQK